MRNWISLIETYSSDNTRLLKHLQDGSFDYYNYWWDIVSWAEETDNLTLLGLSEDDDLTKVREDSDKAFLFEKLPAWAKQEAKEWVISYLIQNNPAEVPSSEMFSLQNNKLLPRQTWLVHFTNKPYNIKSEGFVVGMHDMDKLGLTTYFTDQYKAMAGGGYNFAFLATSREAANAAHQNSYGSKAVIFQNSGVHTYHISDEENQIIFYGPDVDKKNIIVLDKENGDWVVRNRYTGKIVFVGDFEPVIKWVINNFSQYRAVIT